MTIEHWFKPRHYKHFDPPVGKRFAESILEKSNVARHVWTPLIRYVKKVKRYKAKENKTTTKDREIMYASHKDSCVFSLYAYDLNCLLEKYYEVNEVHSNVIAYRSLGRSNYHFASEALEYAASNAPCVFLCFDVSGFFDNLDHKILKDRLKRLIGTSTLSEDWYAVLRNVTRHSFVERDDLCAHSAFYQRIKNPKARIIARISELKDQKIKIYRNEKKRGIPQGTPISSALSNTYMILFDTEFSSLCRKHNAFYRRYSDDIILICKPSEEIYFTHAIEELMLEHKLELKKEKTDRVLFEYNGTNSFQYLGFRIDANGAVIRSSSLGRQWRKAKRALAKTRRIGENAISLNKSTKIYTKSLRRRFAPVGVRNFSSYARQAATSLGSRRIKRQIIRLERMVHDAITSMKATSADSLVE